MFENEDVVTWDRAAMGTLSHEMRNKKRLQMGSRINLV